MRRNLSIRWLKSGHQRAHMSGMRVAAKILVLLTACSCANEDLFKDGDRQALGCTSDQDSNTSRKENEFIARDKHTLQRICASAPRDGAWAAVRHRNSGVTEGAAAVRSRRGFLPIAGADFERPAFAGATPGKAPSNFRKL
jgi:hypothetical protein